MNEHKPFGRVVFILFFLFFGFIIGVNSIFIYYALGTHPGVITQHPYEKGLKFDETINKAKNQPDIKNTVTYNNGILIWILNDIDGTNIDHAKVTVRMVRPIKDGDDKTLTLNYVGNGQYETALDLPVKGQWQALLKAQWDSKEFQTKHEILIQ